jgi:hypothetical protein
LGQLFNADGRPSEGLARLFNDFGHPAFCALTLRQSQKVIQVSQREYLAEDAAKALGPVGGRLE